MSRTAAWRNAVAWVQAHGGLVQGLEYDATLSGVRAAKALAVDDCILRVPQSLWITAREAQMSPVGLAAWDGTKSPTIVLAGTAGDLVLAFHLAAEMQRTDPFNAPHYALLPRPGSADDPRAMLPRCWSDAELEALLRGSPAANEARRARAALLSDYEAMSAVARLAPRGLPDGWPAFDSFDWAMAIVSSRTFALETAAGPIDAIVPLTDMLNHARPRETTYRVVESLEAPRTAHGLDAAATLEAPRAAHGLDAAATLEAPRAAHGLDAAATEPVSGEAGPAALEFRVLLPLDAGRPVHDTYGAKGNMVLLGSFGFALLCNFEPDGSSNDVRELPLPVTSERVPSLVSPL
jgi:hypothetical protein